MERCVRMRAVEVVLAVGWSAFCVYWLVAAFSMKKGRVPWSRELRLRAVIAVAVWARMHIGRNWGTPMTEKRAGARDQRSYSGLLVAGVGTAVALNWLWVTAVALVPLVY
jgi:hypothetical protein